jgi:threonine dehydratase
MKAAPTYFLSTSGVAINPMGGLPGSLSTPATAYSETWKHLVLSHAFDGPLPLSHDVGQHTQLLKALRPEVRVIGVEPELAADARASLEAGEIVRWPAELVSRTIADGTRTQALGLRTFAHLVAHLDSIVTVSEAEIAAGVRLAAERSRLVVEPSGALSVAAMTFHAAEAGLVGIDGAVVAVVSGGNVDPDAYREYLEAPIPAEG